MWRISLLFRSVIVIDEVFEAFQQNSTKDHFMGHPVQQIAYRCCINFAKVNFCTEYSASADTFAALCLIIGNYKAAMIPNMLSIVYAARPITASEERSDANYANLLWRRSSWIRSWRLERACRKPFLTVLRKFEPIVVGHRVDPKRHMLASQRVLWAILRQSPSTRHFSRRVRGKNQNKKEEALYFTYFARRSLTADWHKIWFTCSPRGRNQLCKVLS